MDKIRLLDSSKPEKEYMAIRRLQNASSMEGMYINNKPNIKYFGYFVEDECVGVVGFYIDPFHDVITFVHGFVVKEHRGKGIYKKLCDERLDFCQRYYPEYDIYVTASPRSKHQLEKIGFQVVEPMWKMKLGKVYD